MVHPTGHTNWKRMDCPNCDERAVWWKDGRWLCGHCDTSGEYDKHKMLGLIPRRRPASKHNPTF